MKTFVKFTAIILSFAIMLGAIACGATEEVYYTVKFNSGGISATEIKVKSGDTIAETDFPASAKTGYELKYWTFNGEKVDGGYQVVSDMVLEPYFEPNTYDLSFEGIADVVKVVYDGEVGELPLTPYVEGSVGEWRIGNKSLTEKTVWRYDSNKKATAHYTDSVRLVKYNGEEIDVVPKAMRDYLNCKDEASTAEFLYRYESDWKRADFASPVSFVWSSPESGEFTIYLSTEEDFSDPQIYTTTDKSFSVYNLIPDKEYFWKVKSPSGNESAVDSFRLKGTIRPIYCGNINNMRDLGGYTGEFGKIKYGMVYRSAYLSDANQEAVSILKNDLKLKSEIDVRLDGDTASPDPSITFYNKGYGFWQFDYIFPKINNPKRPFSQTYANNLKNIFMLFATKNKYPIDFHCTAGADRTGTLAFLLCGMLGIGYGDLVKDFEITSLYQRKRWRSDIIVSGNNYSFDPSGVVIDDVNVNLVAFDKMYRHVMEEYGTGDGKLSSAICNYLNNVVGLETQYIEKIRNIMLENYSAE